MEIIPIVDAQLMAKMVKDQIKAGRKAVGKTSHK